MRTFVEASNHMTSLPRFMLPSTIHFQSTPSSKILPTISSSPPSMVIFRINPKRLFSSKKKTPSPAPSNRSSFRDSSSYDSDGKACFSTPTSVLPSNVDWEDRLPSPSETLSFQNEVVPGTYGIEETNISSQELSLLVQRVGKEEELDLAVPVSESELKETFEYFDRDGDGRITPAELMVAFQAMGNPSTLEECEYMVHGVATVGVGYVSFDDFLRMMDRP